MLRALVGARGKRNTLCCEGNEERHRFLEIEVKTMKANYSNPEKNISKVTCREYACECGMKTTQCGKCRRRLWRVRGVAILINRSAAIPGAGGWGESWGWGEDKPLVPTACGMLANGGMGDGGREGGFSGDAGVGHGVWIKKPPGGPPWIEQ